MNSSSVGSNYVENKLKEEADSSSEADELVNHSPFERGQLTHVDIAGRGLHLAGESKPEAVSVDVSSMFEKLPMMTNWVSRMVHCRQHLYPRFESLCDSCPSSVNSQ